MLVVANADFESLPDIGDGLDVTLTGYILKQSSSAPITTGLGTLSSTVSVDEQTATTGPTPTATSGGAFTITIPIATLQSSSLNLIFVTVSSSIPGSRPWTFFIRPWTSAEQDALEDEKFVVNIDSGRGSSQGTIMDSYTGLWHPAEDIEIVDGRPVAKRQGYRSKNLESV